MNWFEPDPDPRLSLAFRGVFSNIHWNSKIQCTVHIYRWIFVFKPSSLPQRYRWIQKFEGGSHCPSLEEHWNDGYSSSITINRSMNNDICIYRNFDCQTCSWACVPTYLPFLVKMLDCWDHLIRVGLKQSISLTQMWTIGKKWVLQHPILIGLVGVGCFLMRECDMHYQLNHL